MKTHLATIKGIPLRQFILFIINGGILGLASWGAQLGIYHLLGGESGINYALATAAIYPPFVVLNFMIQRHVIFLRKGCFIRFVGVNLLIMGLVTLLSPAVRWGVAELFDPVWGDKLGFAIAALFCVPFSFLIKRHWVFRAHEQVKGGD